MTNRLMRLAAFALLLTGCTDPMENEDGLTRHAGLAHEWNKSIHTAGVTAATRLHPNPGHYGPQAEQNPQ